MELFRVLTAMDVNLVGVKWHLSVLLTGFLGGAVATHLRVGDPLLTHVFFPLYVGALLWAGLLLRSGKLGNLLLRTSAS